MQKADIGIIGLSVMGANLARNFENHGYTVVVFNRTPDKTQKFIGQEKDKKFIAANTLKSFVDSLASPKKILMMVKAGNAVDELIDQLLPLLEKEDILIDGGNSYFKDTIRRVQKVEASGKLYIGAGVSGGEEGALHGPSLMPGGSEKAWPAIQPLFQAISAKVTEKNEPCVTWIGKDGAGHFVKMVHNGIEYADMQLIAESYLIMRNILLLKPQDIQSIFTSWNAGALQSYLIEITAKIFSKKDEFSGDFLIDKISDAARQKGTGKWTSQTALDLGVPVPTIIEAVIARSLSSHREERLAASSLFPIPQSSNSVDKNKFLDALADALYASKVIAYAQGFALMNEAAKIYGWNLDFSGIAGIWRGGCIIRAQLLTEIMKAYDKNNLSQNLITIPYFQKSLLAKYENWRFAVSEGIKAGLPLPGFTSALSYFEAFRNPSLPTNLIQAQRDYFGAHTYERIDKEGKFHTDW